MADFAARVLKLVSEPEYKPITLKAMSRRFQIDPDDSAEFRAAVKQLVKEGKLDLAKDKRLHRPDQAGLVIGLFRRSAKGFGFVRPHHSPNPDDQIFIPVAATGDASNGDEVAVKVTKTSRRRGKNLEGRIVRIVARASGVFVGTYFEEAGSGYVRIDGTTFHDPIDVGDPGAKGAKPGDKVAVEIVRYPTPYLEGEGVLTEILGQRGQPGVDTLAIIRAFNIPDTFDAAVLEEARDQARFFDEAQLGDRVDLRDATTVTIDPATARDFDDAITLTRDEQGYWNLAVHIADVAHFVRSGSALDRAARHRGTSVYLPDRVIPMFPEILSNSLASLQAGRTRYTVSVFLEFNPEGVLVSKRFARSAIRVDHRFTYEQALEVMKRPQAHHRGVSAEVARMMGQMLELAMILRCRRFARGALELNLPEVEIELGDQGEVSGAHLAVHDESHQVIEEFMLAANEAVATTLSAENILFLRRAHPDPEPFKLDEFAEFAHSLGLALEQPQSRFELQRVLRETVGQPEEYAVHYGLLRSLKQANYTPEAEGHYALASSDYCHFTSPIRRYPDLLVHRQLIAWLEGNKPASRHDEWVVLAEHCTRTERRAEAAERELIRVKLLTYLEDHIGASFHAIIVAVQDFGLFCRLTELPIEGLIHVTSLADDYYYLESGTHTLVGRRSGRRHRLGDRAVVRIAHVDVDRRELDLVLDQSPLSRGRRRPDDSARPATASLPAPQAGPARPPRGRTRSSPSPTRPPEEAPRPGSGRTAPGKSRTAKSKVQSKPKPKAKVKKGRKKRPG
ncbi:MAG TPA: ribonuclease R [Isosphaeraceae bacterium]|nr:ribonuclease R [Isosphaeraceae bacterium]